METLDKASVYYNSGLILLSALQICMAHGSFIISAERRKIISKT